MSREYYYLISSLPELRLDDYKEPYRVAEFVRALAENLTEEHYRYAREILLLNDHPNIIATVLGNTSPWFSRQGNWSFEELQKKFPFSDDDDAYLYAVMLRISRLKTENAVLRRNDIEQILEDLYYGKMLGHANGFVRAYFTFDRQLRNILVALNKRKFNIKNAEFLELPDEGLVDNLKNISASDFNLARDVDYINALIENFSRGDMLNLEKFIDQLRWNKIDELNTFSYFTIDVLLGYLLKLMLVERWIALDAAKGQEAFEKLILVRKEELYQ